MLARVKAEKTAIMTILTAQIPRMGAWISYNRAPRESYLREIDLEKSESIS